MSDRGRTPDEERHVVGEPDDPAEAEEAELVEELADETAEHNRDEQTTREAIEQELAQRGLSEEGGRLGQHID
ncbi:MAG TPA: hypothetical protein VF743_02385 [Acidimicrobiales bacterium]